ncbi:transposase [Thioploca ingrica]|uniref:Transposase n=1 Tax=Thioploca ingrica TaxID=40754 RepID=A0A090AKQ4_9GAMM|nr:transposase [Thioploca ingrica]
MTEYRRAKIEGATYFFTVNCAERHGNRLLINYIDVLRQVFRKVKQEHPFQIDAIVILPEHLHCIWTLPEGDADYKTRWTLIKIGFSRAIPPGERRSQSRIARGERGIWQRRYWEHLIRGDRDFEQHVDYLHWNPVKHGWVKRVRDWPYSSFHAYVRRGIYPADWACQPAETINGGE